MSAPIDWDEDVPDADPATKTWREALGLSTSARLRAVERELSEAREQMDRRLHEALMAKLDVERQLVAARAEVERLTARIARQRGHYELTEKGLAAIEPGETEEQP